jgi:hypothetical protein
MDDIKNTLSKLDALSHNNTSQSNKHLTEGNTGAIVKDIAGKAVRRAVPVVGTALSWDEAYDRWKQGDRTGAVISGLAGGAYLIPGVGLAAGVALDAANVGRDIKAGQYDDLPQQAKDWYDEKSKSVKDLGQSIQNTGQTLKSVDGYVRDGVKENTMKNIERKSKTKNKVNQRSLTEEEQLNEILGWLRKLVRGQKRATPTPRPTSRPAPGTSPSKRDDVIDIRARDVTDRQVPATIQSTAVGSPTSIRPAGGGTTGARPVSGGTTGARPVSGGGSGVTPGRATAGVATAAAVGGGTGYALSGDDDNKKPSGETGSATSITPSGSVTSTSSDNRILGGLEPGEFTARMRPSTQNISTSSDNRILGGLEPGEFTARMRPSTQSTVQYAPVAATQPAAVSPTPAVIAPATTAASPTSVDSSDSSATPAGGNSTYSLTANNSTSPQGSVLSPGFATRTGPFQFTDAQKQWLGGANPQDPYIIARMRRAVGGPLPPVDYFKNPEDQAIARQLNVGRDNLNRVRGAVGSKPLGTDGNFPDQNQPPPAKKPRWQPTEPLPTNLESVYPNKKPLNVRENRHSAVNRLTRKFENYIENKFNIVENNYVPKKKNLR